MRAPDLPGQFSPVELIRDQPVRARQAHRCMWCGREIAKGLRYYKLVYRDAYDRFQSRAVCVGCHATEGR